MMKPKDFLKKKKNLNAGNEAQRTKKKKKEDRRFFTPELHCLERYCDLKETMRQRRKFSKKMIAVSSLERSFYFLGRELAVK
ncbi:hypothetical protein AXX17_AT5G03030 [Arabidopsis thaliana]|uniref:Uncharacterized protein n=1 Tax=Arabidopsis thaliana TaxID=3702 RepID=A0A178UQ16_ARATH|nr:hypothetical protein AXX17_AT5G03030 [Arabidopsis thaliana]